MDLWFSEVHTPDVKLSLRTAKQLYAGKSEWQDIEVLDTPAFGKILILNGHVLFSDADDFVYNEMTVHVPMAVHPNPKKVLVIGGGDGGVAQVLTLYPELEQCWRRKNSKKLRFQSWLSEQGFPALHFTAIRTFFRRFGTVRYR